MTMPINMFPEGSSTLVQKAPKDRSRPGLGKPQSAKGGALASKVNKSRAVATGGANTPFHGSLGRNKGGKKGGDASSYHDRGNSSAKRG